MRSEVGSFCLLSAGDQIVISHLVNNIPGRIGTGVRRYEDSQMAEFIRE